MRLLVKLAAAASVLVLGSTNVLAAPIIYTINTSVGLTGNVSGTITTDGTIGTLSSSNFTAWNLVISGQDQLGHLISESLTNLNSGVYTGGLWPNVGSAPGLVASATNITFDFSNPTPAYLLFQKVFGSGTSFFCVSRGNTANLCDDGLGLVPTNTDPDGTFAGQGASQGVRQPTGNFGLATTVPEPATWLTMFAGLGMVGFAMRRKQQTATRARIAFA